MNEPIQNRPDIATPAIAKWVPLPMAEWSAQERWVWDRVSTGKVADFNDTSLDFNRGGRELKPENEEDWKGEEGQRRLLRSAFLETILLHEPWRGAIPRRGVRIMGALFEEIIDLCNAELAHELWLEQSRLANGLVMSDARLPFCFSLEGSCLSEELSLDRAKIAGDLVLRQGGFASAGLLGVEVGGQLDMTGASFTGELAMDGAKIAGDLFLRQGGFASARLLGVEVGGQLDMEGASFTGTGVSFTGGLALDRAKIARDLSFRFFRQVNFASVRMVGVEVGGELSMDGARFIGELVMEGASIAGNLFLGQGRFAGARLHGVAVGGSANMGGASFTGGLAMDGAKIAGVLVLSQGSFTGVRLPGVEVGGQLDMRDGTCLQSFLAPGLVVKDSVFLDDTRLFGSVDLTNSDLGSNLYLGCDPLEAARMGGPCMLILDLSGASIEGELCLAEGGEAPPSWLLGGYIKLRNAAAAVVKARPGDWPRFVDLEGFTYGQLEVPRPLPAPKQNEESPPEFMGWFFARQERRRRKKAAAFPDYPGWLERQPGYAAQPYEQCAKVLREAGRSEKANKILFKGMVHQRKEAWKGGRGGRWLWLLFRQAAIGHGLGQYTFLSVLWVVVLGLLFTCVAFHNPPTNPPGEWTVWSSLFYSFDTLLPVLKLSKAHENLVFPQGAAIWFYVEKVLGWLLGFFVVAGLTGLTRKP